MSRLAHPTTGLETDKKPRKFKNETVTDCFTGTNPVLHTVFFSNNISVGKQLGIFLLEKNLVSSEMEVLLVGSLLLEHKHIYAIGVQTEFKGKKNEIWKFTVSFLGHSSGWLLIILLLSAGTTAYNRAARCTNNDTSNNRCERKRG